MRSRFAFEQYSGHVVSFDPAAGTGVVSAAGKQWPFHCTQISSGARSIPLGEDVRFDVVAGVAGRWEAVRVRALPGTFLCPVCGWSIGGVPGGYDICPQCDWEDDPTQLEDANSSGANQHTLSETRSLWLRAEIQRRSGDAADGQHG
jgi:cold shock CspA family protein